MKIAKAIHASRLLAGALLWAAATMPPTHARDAKAPGPASPGAAGAASTVAPMPAFGKFLGPIVVEFLGAEQGRNVRVARPFKYVDMKGTIWEVPEGMVTDGATIPQVFWTIIGGPFDGPWRDAAIVHDRYCKTQDRPWQAVHEMFYEAMLAAGVEPLRAKVMYAAVYAGGPRWEYDWRRLEPRVPLKTIDLGGLRTDVPDPEAPLVTPNPTEALRGPHEQVIQAFAEPPETVVGVTGEHSAPSDGVVGVHGKEKATAIRVLVRRDLTPQVDPEAASRLAAWVEQSNPSLEEIRQRSDAQTDEPH